MDIIQEVLLAILRGAWTVIIWTWWVIIPVILYFTYLNIKKARYVEKVEHDILSIKIPKNNDKGPVAAEMMFASLHGILQPKKDRQKGDVVQEHLSFEIVATTNAIEFFVWVPKHLRDFVEGQVYAQYPTAEIAVVDDYTTDLDVDEDNIDEHLAGTELSLVKNEIYPIKTFQNFDVDPLAGITGMLSKLDGDSEKVWIQMLAKPVDDNWRNRGLSYIQAKKSTGASPSSGVSIIINEFKNLAGGVFKELTTHFLNTGSGKDEKKEKKDDKPKLSHSEETELTAIEEKANKLGFIVKLRVVYLADSTTKAKERIQAVVGAFKQFNSTNLNGFQGDKIYTGVDFLNAYRARLIDNTSYVLNIEELASLFHLPHVSVETPNIVWTSSKKGEPPAHLPYINDLANVDPDITVLATTTHRGSFKPFGIKRDDRARHMYIIGKSGTGKSRLIESLAINDIQRGEGVGIVDPHGELIDRVLKFIPKERLDDVIYFNPADRDFPIAFNPLEADPEFREEVVNGFVSVLKKLFGYSWGPRLEYVLKHTVSALVEVEGSTMLGIVRMLTDKNYRKKIVGQVSDPVVQMFWLKEFASYNDKMETETIAPILNKVGQFTASPIIRNIVGQPHSKIDFAKVMNDQKILLVDLSTGKIGEANSELLGSMLITKLQLAAMSRAYIPENERKDFYLYVDEFQTFATESFAVILSEARKYKLSLTVANQYIAQMDETVRDAVFGNVGTLISFRVGATDGAYLEKEFTPVFMQNDLINLDTRHIYLNMLIDGITSIPFSAMTLESPSISNDMSSAIKAISREKYASSKESIETDIRNWYNVDSVIAGVNANEKDNPIKNQIKDERSSRHSEEKSSRGESIRTKQEPIKNKFIPNNDLKKALSEAIKNQPTVETKKIEPVIKRQAPASNDFRPKDKIANNAQTYSPLKEKGKHDDRRARPNINKESLKKILRKVATPDGTTDHGEGDSVKQILSNPTPTSKTYDRGVTSKEITPEEFRSLSAIHPNEKITIKKPDTGKEIQPGEVIKF